MTDKIAIKSLCKIEPYSKIVPIHSNQFTKHSVTHVSHMHFTTIITIVLSRLKGRVISFLLKCQKTVCTLLDPYRFCTNITEWRGLIQKKENYLMAGYSEVQYNDIIQGVGIMPLATLNSAVNEGLWLDSRWTFPRHDFIREWYNSGLRIWP